MPPWRPTFRSSRLTRPRQVNELTLSTARARFDPNNSSANNSKTLVMPEFPNLYRSLAMTYLMRRRNELVTV